jgi:hypothetical protein
MASRAISVEIKILLGGEYAGVNFAQRSIFSHFTFFKEPENLQIWDLISLYCIVLYCIVLKGWSLLPNALQPFQDRLCSPEFKYY